ncbi:hypothetical protein BDZ85DRAFT_284530 [Elsinoe ampelina]|uniref:Nephrocystin 3-like N-terminal domain-containing protein n=1 Tax=Elsinoe ampelina TaxID=302913 RepID=A0A6A6G2Y6_9PEZI|nr:hypothetical protein BDZ85DRAFT_284530 [Elsinoe ampelina]
MNYLMQAEGDPASRDPRVTKRQTLRQVKSESPVSAVLDPIQQAVEASVRTIPIDAPSKAKATVEWPIANAGMSCDGAFAQITALQVSSEMSEDNSAPFEQLEWERGRFRLWSGNLGALQAGPSSLDARLSEAPGTRAAILRSLGDLYRALASCVEILSGIRDPLEKAFRSTDYMDDTSTSEEESQAEESIGELEMHMKTIRDILGDLYRLSFKIRRSGGRAHMSTKAKQYKDMDSALNLDKLASYTAFDRGYVIDALIQMRKEAKSASKAAVGTTASITSADDFLISRLIRTMDQRRRMLSYRRRHARKLAELPRGKTLADPTNRLEPSRQENAPVHSMRNRSVAVEKLPVEPIGTLGGSHISGTKATTAAGNLDELIDTDSVISFSSSTFLMSPEDDDLPPSPVKRASEFLCAYCNITCPRRDGTGTAWKLHVVQDIQPYICTYEDCKHETHCFASSKQWLEHEKTQHRKIWQCYQHAEAFYMSSDALRRHLESSHQSDMTHLQLEQLLTGTSSFTVDTRSTCLFCNAVGPFVEGLEKHMAAHMIRFAQFSIPRVITISEDNEVGAEEQTSVAAQGLYSDASAIVEGYKAKMDTIKFAWICATENDYVVARAMLDEYDLQYNGELPAGGDLSLGRIGEQDIVIAQCPPGKSTGAVARDIVNLFPNIESAISAGIAGALPTPAMDVRLGDVVIACSSTTSTGLVEWQRGKDPTTIGKDYKLLPPSTLAALYTMRRKTEGHQAIFDRILQQALDSAEETLISSSERPDPRTDKLIHPSFRHPEHSPSCETCASAAEVPRSARTEILPHAHHDGFVASGNYVITSSDVRDGLQKATGAVCADDYSSLDIMRYLPCVVVRGISDYADSHKTKLWQPYAGLAAAAYVKELILSIDVSDAVSQEEAADFVTPHLSPVIDASEPAAQASSVSAASSASDNGIVSTSDDDVGQDLFFGRGTTRNTGDPPKLSLLAPQHDESIRCLWWFKNSPYEEFKDVHRHRHPSTCQWVLENDKFRSWLHGSSSSLLWITARSGVGKSVFARSLVDQDLIGKMPRGTTVCHFFFADAVLQNHFATALCAVLHKLYDGQLDLIEHALPHWRARKDELMHNTDILWKILLDSCADPRARPVICILDGLQACRDPDTSQLCSYLTKLNDQSPWCKGSLKILVTSHSFPTNLSQMQASSRPISTISDKDDTGTVGIEADLSAVTKEEIVKHGADMGLSNNAMLRIGQQLMSKSDGTFMWHNLALEWLRRNLVSRMVDEEVLVVLSRLPKSIPSFYTETLAIIPPPKTHIFRPIFMLVSGACQTLTAFELFGALRLFPDDHVRDEVGLLGANFGLIDMIKNDSGGLLIVSESGIRLSSPMVRDCLLGETNHTSIKFDAQDVVDMMAFLCLRCLLVFQPEGPAKFNYFVSYATPYAAHHIAKIPAISQLDVSALTTLIGDRSGNGGLKRRAELIRLEQERIATSLKATDFHPGSWELEVTDLDEIK